MSKYSDILNSAVEAGHLKPELLSAEREFLGPFASFFNFDLSDSFSWEPGNPLAILDGPITGALYSQVREWLSSTKDAEKRTINVDSQGGVATAGIAVFNQLRAEKNVAVNVVGQAYSAAGFIVQGASTRHISTGATIGVHPAWMMTMGDKKVMSAASKKLQLMDDLVLNLYMSRAKVAESEIAAALDADTNLAGPEAIRMGLADTAGNDDKLAPDRGMRLPEKAKEEDDDTVMNAATTEIAASPIPSLSRFRYEGIGSNRNRI